MDTHVATGAVKEAAGKAERKYGEIKDRVTQGAREMMEGDDFAGTAEGTWNTMRMLVQENPGSAIGLSLLVGAGLGALIAYLSKD